MKHLLHLLTAATLPALLAGAAAAAPGFTDSVVTFYGEVRQVGGAQTVLLQAGKLELTLVNQSNPTNSVTLEADLRPTGEGDNKPFSYAIDVPLAYLPEAPRLNEFLSIGATATSFKITAVTIDGRDATLPDGSKEFYGLSFASRGTDYRLDLLVAGESLDSDGDGLPDWWEKLHGLDPLVTDSGEDPDSDGWSNLDEFNQGGNPNVSNREPRLATSEILVSESGEAGVFLHILDSDSQPADIAIAFTGNSASGFTLDVDGVALADGEVQNLTLADLRRGRLGIRHTTRALKQFVLPLSWNDGGELQEGEVFVRVTTPSTGDGNDSTLWLDGMDLAADGSSISLWKDRSGNARNASQPFAAHQPAVAGHSADFSASTSAHLFFQDVAISTTNHTVLAAYKAADSSEDAQTLLATNRGFLKIAPTRQAISYPGAPVYQMDGLATQGYVDISGKESTSTFRREGSLMQNVFGLSYDGQGVAAETIEPVLPTLGGLRAAVPNADPIAEAFSGQLHELLVFPTALPEQKLRDVHDYLASKWDSAVIWDLSTDIKPVNLAATSATRPQIIRGGHGDDRIGGGPLDDTLSGGAGADILTGGGGVDRFVFGGVDTGKDRITDFDLENDIIDLSALFWGQTGDARQSVSVRLDANFSTSTPTLDTVLIVKRPSGATQEITLENKVVSSNQLIQLIVEGRLRMGGLSVPATVQIALAPGSPAGPLTESLDQPFSIVVSRSGAGTAAALDVPLGFFENALGGHFIIDGAVENESRRSVVRFARGETSKTLTVRPVPDLETDGPTNLQVAVLPQYKFAVAGSSIQRTLTDRPMVWLEVVTATAVSDTAQPAVLRVHRDGASSDALTINVRLGGTAQEGVHILDLPDSVTLSAGQESAEISISPLAAGLASGPKVVLFQLAPATDYQLGNPHEAVIYAAISAIEANGAGFDRWIQASTGGSMRGLRDLAGLPRDQVARYLRAYAFGLDSPDKLDSHGINFRIANGRPEILTNSNFRAADVRWGVEASSSLGEDWSDDSADFNEGSDPTGIKLVGEPLPAQAKSKFYRLSMDLQPGRLATTSITELAGTTRFGISGSGSWDTDTASGDLISTGGSVGQTRRIVAEADGGTALGFEMSIPGGGPSDRLVFYIDGVKQAETSSAAVTVSQHLAGTGKHLLMWEFKRGSGKALIRKTAP